MKGLWLKDMKLLKNQKSFLAVIAAISIGFLLSGQNPSSVVSYMMVMCSILVISTIAYDEQNNGLAFLLVLPVSRKQYVREKYALGIGLMLAAIVAGEILSVLVSLIKPSVYEKEGWIVVLLASVLMAVLIQSVTIPIQLKFGAEKSRIAMLVAIGCVALAAYLVVKIADSRHMDVGMGIVQLVQNDRILFVGCGLIVAALLMGVSYAASLQIMKKKQF